MTPITHIDELLRAAAVASRTPTTGGDESTEPAAEVWTSLERHLQHRAECLAAGQEAPGLPTELATALFDYPEIRRAYVALAADVADAVRRARPAAATAAAAGEETAGASVRAVLRYLRDKWAAVSAIGLDLVQPELILARGTASAPLAMQGVVGDSFLVALHLSGDPTRGCALDVLCQEVRPGATTPKPVPTFCLRTGDGKRFHSHDRVAHVDGLHFGRHVLQLEVTGQNRGAIVLNLEDGADEKPSAN